MTIHMFDLFNSGHPWATVFFIGLAYLLGSFSSAILTCQYFGLPDPRQHGSGNPGATNVLRSGHKQAAVLTLLGDFIKGVLPILLARWWGMPEILLGYIALATVLGHAFPLFYNFRGGKGVATAAGAIFAMTWPVGILICLTWLLVARGLKISSLGAIIAACAAPLYAIFLAPVFSFEIFLIALLVITRHHSNLKRLWLGEEDAFNRKNKDKS